jgi:hypothetical protein
VRTFASDIGQKGLERNATVERDAEASSAIIHGTSFRGLSIVIQMTYTFCPPPSSVLVSVTNFLPVLLYNISEWGAVGRVLFCEGAGVFHWYFGS